MIRITKALAYTKSDIVVANVPRASRYPGDRLRTGAGGHLNRLNRDSPAAGNPVERAKTHNNWTHDGITGTPDKNATVIRITLFGPYYVT